MLEGPGLTTGRAFEGTLLSYANRLVGFMSLDGFVADRIAQR